MVCAFYKNQMFFLICVQRNKQRHCTYSMCGDIKTLKHSVRTTLQLAYHGCQNLTQTSKTRHIKRTQMVVTVRSVLFNLFVNAEPLMYFCVCHGTPLKKI